MLKPIFHTNRKSRLLATSRNLDQVPKQETFDAGIQLMHFILNVLHVGRVACLSTRGLSQANACKSQEDANHENAFR